MHGDWKTPQNGSVLWAVDAAAALTLVGEVAWSLMLVSALLRRVCVTLRAFGVVRGDGNLNITKPFFRYLLHITYKTICQ